MRSKVGARRLGVSIAASVAAIALGAVSTSAPAGAATLTSHAKLTIRLGYLANLTHAADLLAISNGDFSSSLGPNVTLSSTAFSAGPDAVTALLAGQLDAAFLGPNPAASAFQVSHGQFQIVAGEASGGAALVVQPSITRAQQLKGKTLSSPQLGNSQDVSLRMWLKSKGLSTSITGGGSVTILPQANAQIVTAFRANAIAGAWVPQPYVAELVAAGGHVLVNEASLWPKGQFATTVLVVNKSFVRSHPVAVKNLIRGELEAIATINANKVAAEPAINAAIKAVTGKTLKAGIMRAALPSITFTYDPIATSIDKDVLNAYKLGFLTSASLKGIYNVTLLNQLLVAQHKAPVVAV